MNWNQIEGNWKQLKGDFKQQWEKVTDDFKEVNASRKEKIAGTFQENFGVTKDDKKKPFVDSQSKPKD